jgi:ubiquinone/menaquinone biosynthesis C-methylase UbiE
MTGHFDAVAGTYYQRNYDHPRTRHERGLALRREICLNLLDGTEHEILDLGCGPGALAVPLAVAGKQVVALDLAPKMVEAARRNITERGATASYCVADAVALPFAAAAFDAVVTTGVLEYVPDVRRAVAEIARVLRPGGTVIATATLPRVLERAFDRRLSPLVLRLKGRAPQGAGAENRGFSPDEFDALMRDAGLAIEERRFSYFAPFPFDALFPPLVSALDRFAPWLARSGLAREQAKTYIVKARRR